MLFLFLMASISGIAQQHTVTSFTPTYAGTGDVVTIVGTNFSSITGVSFGATAATSFTVVSSTKITAVVASGTTGSITVTKTGVGTPNVARVGFTYSTLPTVTRIITDFGSFWDTNTTTTNPIFPDNSHNLMAFSYQGTTYSTGVNDAGLTSRGVSFTPGVFKALPAVLTGTTGTSASLYIAAGRKIDGNANSGIYTNNNVKNLTLQNVLTDGINGLNLGTGYTNLPATATSNYTVLSIDPTKISDSEPDILVTQIADPTGVATDTYKFVNSVGATVGNSLSISLAALSKLGTYSLDLFAVAQNTSFSLAKPVSAFGSNTTRDIRFVGFKLSDFGINAGNYASIVSLQVTPSGVSDSAFMGYNANSINVPPSIAINTSATNSVVCTSGGGNAFLSVYGVSIGGGSLTYSWEVSTNGGSSWSTVSNNGTYSGATTSGLTITAATSGYLYRATVTEVSSGLTATSSNFTITAILSSALAGTLNPTALNLCLNSIVAVTSLSVAPTGGAGTYSYQWSTSTSAGGTYTDISGAIFSSYSPDISALGTKYYKVKITSGCTSNTPTATAVTITGDDILTFANGVTCTTGAVTLSATNVTGTASNINWYTVATAGTSQGTGLSFNTPSIATTTTYYVGTVSGGCNSTRQAVTATVANTISLTSANFSIPNTTSICPGTGSVVSVSTSGLVDGTYTANYTVSGSNSLTSTASIVISGGFGTFTTGNLANSGSNTITITGIVMSGCTITPASGNTATITVITGSIPGSISGATTVCTGTNSTTLTLSGFTGNIQWQSSPNNGSYTNLIGENSSTYTATDLGATTYYRANVVNGACASANSSIATVTVSPLSVGGTASGTTTVFVGTNSATLTLSGHTGSIQWQSSSNNVSFNNISGANSTTYNATNLLATTYYRAVLTSGVCSSDISNVVTVSTISLVPGTVSGGTNVCSAVNSTLLTLSGQVGNIVRWQRSSVSDFSSNVTNISNTSTSLTATNVSATTYYRAEISGGGSTVYSSTAMIFINSVALVLQPISGPINLCGMTSATYTVPAIPTGSTNYIWTLPAGLSVYTSIGNELVVNVDPLFESGYISVKAVNNCGVSNTVSIFVSKTPYLTSISGLSSVCGATTATYSTTTISGATYAWTVPNLMTITSGQGTSSITVSIGSGYTSGVVRVQASSNCGVSENKRLPVYSSIIPTTINGPGLVCGLSTATFSTPAISGASFVWSVTSGMSIVSGQGTTSILVSFSGGFTQGIIGVSANTACGLSPEQTTIVSTTRTPKTITGPKVLCGMYRNTYDESGNLLNSTPGQGIYSIVPFPGATSYTWSVPSGATIASGQGTASIVVNFDLANFINGDISVAANTSCGTSPSSSINVVRLGGEITGPAQICSLTSATYSIPTTIGTGFNWTVPSIMTITSGQGTNTITVDVNSTSICTIDSVVRVAFTSNCSTAETVSLNVRCSDFTKVRADQCGATLESISSILYTDSPGNSAPSMYKLRITDGVVTNYAESANGKFAFISTPGFDWQFGATYTVDIALKIDGSYKDYGCACTVTMPSLPTTKIQASQCNTTVGTVGTSIYADWVNGATSYKFRIFDGVTTQYITRPTRVFNMYNFVWAYNTTYTIDVAVKRGTGSFGDYGPTCTISSPSSIAKHIDLDAFDNAWEVSFDQNPFDTYFNLNVFSNSSSSIQVVIFDVSGKQLENKKINPDEMINTHFGENLSSGVYFVNVSQGLNNKTLKMMKK